MYLSLWRHFPLNPQMEGFITRVAGLAQDLPKHCGHSHFQLREDTGATFSNLLGQVRNINANPSAYTVSKSLWTPGHTVFQLSVTLPLFAAVTPSALLGRLYAIWWNTAVSVWLHSATKASVRSGTDVEWLVLDQTPLYSQRYFHNSTELNSF